MFETAKCDKMVGSDGNTTWAHASVLNMGLLEADMSSPSLEPEPSSC